MRRSLLVFWFSCIFLPSFSQAIKYKPDTHFVQTKKSTLQKQNKFFDNNGNALLNIKENAADGLVADYPFCGNANDVSGNGNNGTVVGATLTADRFGNASSAYQFNGINNTITFSGVPTNNTDNWAISAWINPSSSSQAGMAVSMGYDDTNILALANGYAFGIGNGNGTSFYNGSNLMALYCNISFYNTYSSLSTNTWYHIVMQREAGVQKIYVNGILLSFYNYTTPYPPTSFTIGSQNGIRYFNGKVDDVKIYDKALTVTEITSLYNTSSICTSTGLVADYPFCGNANDVSGNGYNGTVEGATLTIDRFGNANSAYYFDGISNFIRINGLPDINEDISISLWIKSSSVNFLSTKTSQLLWRGDSQFAKDPYMVYFHNSKLGFRRDFSTGSTYEIDVSTSLLDTLNFHHIVSTYNSQTSTMKLYIDDNLQANSTLLTGSIDYSTKNFWNIIGAVDFGNSQNYKGIIDDIKIYNRSLSDSEITSLYNAPAPCTCTSITSVAYAGPDIDLCTFAGVTLGTTAVSGYHYQWSPGKYLSDSTVSNPVLTSPYNGNIIVRVGYNETDCLAFDTLRVSIDDSSFTVNIPTQIVSECKDAILVADNSLPQNRYIWSTGQNSKTITVKKSGLYWIKTFNSCTSYQDTIDVQIIYVKEVVPNIITPNGDGFNDIFKFEGCFALDTDFTFMVYNRWGSNVYKSDKYQLDWDANGLSDGLYYYTLKDNKTGEVVKKSWLEIAR